jgi:hypothetical protein
MNKRSILIEDAQGHAVARVQGHEGSFEQDLQNAKEIIAQHNLRSSKDLQVLENCLLINPENAEPVNIATRPQNNTDGSFSFEVIGTRTGQRWRHTIRTEEV